MRNKTRRGKTVAFVRFAVSTAMASSEYFGLLKCEAAWFGRQEVMFRKNLFPATSKAYFITHQQITLHHIPNERNRDVHYFCLMSLTASVALRFVSKFRKFCSDLSLTI